MALLPVAVVIVVHFYAVAMVVRDLPAEVLVLQVQAGGVGRDPGSRGLPGVGR